MSPVDSQRLQLTKLTPQLNSLDDDATDDPEADAEAQQRAIAEAAEAAEKEFKARRAKRKKFKRVAQVSRHTKVNI